MNKEKTNTSLRMSVDAKHLLQELARKLGISQTSVIEIAIRRLAEIEKVE